MLAAYFHRKVGGHARVPRTAKRHPSHTHSQAESVCPNRGGCDLPPTLRERQRRSGEARHRCRHVEWPRRSSTRRARRWQRGNAWDECLVARQGSRTSASVPPDDTLAAEGRVVSRAIRPIRERPHSSARKDAVARQRHTLLRWTRGDHGRDTTKGTEARN